MRKLSLRSESSPAGGPKRTLLTAASWNARCALSAARPTPWLSEPIIEIAPMSCSTSSARIVSARARPWMKAMSVGTALLRLWHVISMSISSSYVFSEKGFVGFVELGRMFASPTQRMMSGALPPPAPSQWYTCITRPPIASSVSS